MIDIITTATKQNDILGTYTQKSTVRIEVITWKPYCILPLANGDKEARTPDPCNAIAVLYQLSYDP